ncbi:MAG: GGDEF domain-containing protein [Glaciimonas sp.]|nr:GGDEF domain-containing protein [Glaciimonas sp.]
MKDREQLLEENAKLKHLISQFTGLLDSIPDPVFMKDSNLRWIYGNPVILNLYSIDKNNYIGKTEDQLLPEEFAESCMQSDRDAVAGRRLMQSEERARTDDGVMHYYEVFKVPFHDESTGEFKGLIGVGRDITERKKVQDELETNYLELQMELKLRKELEEENRLQQLILEQKTKLADQAERLTMLNTSLILEAEQRKNLEAELQQLAYTDPLTGLNNRRRVMELAENEFERYRRNHQSTALLMIDLDHFKKINDTFGHQTGDAVLRQFAKQCRSELRKIDIVGRFGGEEFIVILIGLDKNQIGIVAEKLRAAFHSIQCIPDHVTYPLSISIGIYIFTETLTSLDEAILLADEALYEAKRQGRNRVAWA